MCNLSLVWDQIIISWGIYWFCKTDFGAQNWNASLLSLRHLNHLWNVSLLRELFRRDRGALHSAPEILPLYETNYVQTSNYDTRQRWIVAEMSYSSVITVMPQTKPTNRFTEIKQRAEDNASCVQLIAFYTGIINSLPVTPYNLPGVGVEALPHVTDISDLIWLVITPSHSFRAFHTSVLQL